MQNNKYENDADDETSSIIPRIGTPNRRTLSSFESELQEKSDNSSSQSRSNTNKIFGWQISLFNSLTEDGTLE